MPAAGASSAHRYASHPHRHASRMSRSSWIVVVGVLATAVLLLWWFLTLRRNGGHSTLPLRRRVNPLTLQGVERQHPIVDPSDGRRLLHRLRHETRALLLPRGAAWVVVTGKNLSVMCVDDGVAGSVLAEYTFHGQPHWLPPTSVTAPSPLSAPSPSPSVAAMAMAMAMRPAAMPASTLVNTKTTTTAAVAPKATATATAAAPVPAAAAPVSLAAAPVAVASVREVPGAIGVSPVAIVDPSAIRAFASLESAAAAARVGPDANGVTDHIVGGSPLHPIYYVVPIRTSSTTPGGELTFPPKADATQSSQVASSYTQRVWVRTAPTATTGQ